MPFSRFSRLRHVATAATVVGVLAGAAMIVLASVQMRGDARWWMLAAGVALLVTCALGTIVVRLAIKVESNTSRLYSETRELHEVVKRHLQLLERISENTSISEAAKSIAHRSREREALRGAIYEEVRQEDFDAAFHLIDDLEQRLGYRDEAERLRGEIRDACNSAFRNKLRQAITHVNGLLDKQQWPQARREIERLHKVMPDEQRLGDLWKVYERKRGEHKQSLFRAWNTALAEGNVERGIEILQELDQYVTREEARSLESDARGMFKERLSQLGIQFQFAVKEKRWRDALTVGLQIMEDFPNARMAEEVRAHLGPLRARAGIPSDVDVTFRHVPAAEPSDSAPQP